MADFDGLSLADRQCYFEYERPLQLFSRYTSDNCWVECLINRTRMENGNACTPWNMPSPVSRLAPSSSSRATKWKRGAARLCFALQD